MCFALCDYYSIQLKKFIRYEKNCYSDVRSKAYMTQINLQHGTTTNSGEQEAKRIQRNLSYVASRLFEWRAKQLLSEPRSEIMVRAFSLDIRIFFIREKTAKSVTHPQVYFRARRPRLCTLLTGSLKFYWNHVICSLVTIRFTEISK